MQKRFEMAMVPNEPKELKPGMLCRSIEDGADENTYYFLDESSDLTYEGLHQSVIPFIVHKENEAELNMEKLYLFRFEDGGCCIAYPKEIFDMNDVVSAQQVMVSPEQIGLVYAEGHGSKKKSPISIDDINSIMSKGGWCFIEVDDEFTAPERFQNVSWGDSEPEVKLENGMCIISF